MDVQESFLGRGFTHVQHQASHRLATFGHKYFLENKGGIFFFYFSWWLKRWYSAPSASQVAPRGTRETPLFSLFNGAFTGFS